MNTCDLFNCDNEAKHTRYIKQRLCDLCVINRGEKMSKILWEKLCIFLLIFMIGFIFGSILFHILLGII